MEATLIHAPYDGSIGSTSIEEFPPGQVSIDVNPKKEGVGKKEKNPAPERKKVERLS